jgi:hypothetical protein
MVLLHSAHPQKNKIGSVEGTKYFEPSLARTATGSFIPARTLQMDDYCLKCHEDAYKGWFHSAHHFSSFNNKPYLFSVRETRQVALKRDGNVNAARWCAGCHDVVPFFSGAFDDPKFDDVNHPTAQAGITCTACHAITHINSTKGNADYTIDEPVHYPLAYSTNRLLQYINQQLVKAKPEFHKKTLHRLPPRPESVRYLPAQRRFRSWRPQFLLSRKIGSKLRRLPHAAAAVAGFWSELFQPDQYLDPVYP